MLDGGFKDFYSYMFTPAWVQFESIWVIVIFFSNGLKPPARMVVDFQGFCRSSSEHRCKILGSSKKKACDKLTAFHDLAPWRNYKKNKKKNKFSSNLHLWGVKSSEPAISTIKYPYPNPDPMGWEYLPTAISPGVQCGHFSPPPPRNRGNHEFAYMSRLWMGPNWGGIFPRGVFFCGVFKYVLNQNRPEIIENPLQPQNLSGKILIHEVIPSFSTNAYRPKRLRSPRRWRWRESWQKSLQIFDFWEFQVNAQNQVSSCWIHLCVPSGPFYCKIPAFGGSFGNFVEGLETGEFGHPVFFWSVFCGP